MDTTPVLVSWTERIENEAVLDAPVQAIEPTIRAVFGSGKSAGVLRGDWLGHAVHPSATDLVLGSWASASILDLVGGRDAAPAAQRLVGIGVLAFFPTAWTGWLGAEDQDKRVGLVHAVTNGVAAGAYYASWSARRRGTAHAASPSPSPAPRCRGRRGIWVGTLRPCARSAATRRTRREPTETLASDRVHDGGAQGRSGGDRVLP